MPPSIIRASIMSSRIHTSIVAAIAVTITVVFTSRAVADTPHDAATPANVTGEFIAKEVTPTPVPGQLGVVVNESCAFPGYNLITPSGETTYLYDNEGREVHSWTSEYSGHSVAYLLDNGHLFRTAEAANRKPGFQGPAAGGRFQEFDWDGNVLWDFEYHSEKRLPHHDAIRLPNGNALLICWEMINEKEAIAQGRRPETVKDSHLQPDCLVEIKPTGRTTGDIVWEWHAWDHLIQDLDTTKPNFGRVAEHPERFDVNYVRGEGNPNATNPDWMHVNAVAYNAELDQVVLSSPAFSEIWIIDHGTTTEEARGHTGGRWGKGGDILYRWGNPGAYRNGTKIDQRLYFQHNIHWIPKGQPGEGHLLVFNNGQSREPEEYSSVDEFEPPTDKAGNYVRREHAPFGPDSALWSYTATNKTDFYSWFISGAQRLPNGNTLINSGANGIVFEVTPEKEIVWKFVNPFKNAAPGAPPRPRPFEVVPGSIRDALSMKKEQREKLDQIDQELNTKLDDILSDEQRKSLTDPNDIDVSTIPAGEYLTAFKSDKLKLTEAQMEKLQALASDFNPQIAKILTEDQKGTIERVKKDSAGPRGGNRRMPGNTLFRATRYGLHHPAFDGRLLTPGKTLVEIQQEREKTAAPKD